MGISPTGRNLAQAKADLGDGGRFGLAAGKDLLDRGESATVVEYLQECGNFWEGNRGKLAEWTALVKAGLKPDFGANLGY